MTIIRGHIVSETGLPVTGASVYVISAPVSMPDIAQLTDSKGLFQLAVPVPGDYLLGVRSEIYGTKETSFSVKDEKSLDIQIRFDEKMK